MRTRFLLALPIFATLVPAGADAQITDSPSRQPVALITGLAVDSINGGPLVGALVQLAGTGARSAVARSVTSDSLGRFRFADVPLGEYLIGFFHPVLDSLGIEPGARMIYVDLPRPMRADVGVPSGATITRAVCGTAAGADASATVLGVVRDPRDRAAIAAATVTVDWIEFSVGPSGFSQQRRRRTATTAADGRFAVCDVPPDARIALWAAHDGRTTDLLELELPASRLLRRDLYLAPAGDATGRLGGIVVSAATGRPLSGAQVRVVNGPETRSNERGEWSLPDAPLGTRTLEVRALGYVPTQLAVNVAADEPPLRLALPTMQAVLDTVRVTASRLDAVGQGFESRRRSSGGHFLGAEEVARRAAINTSDLFRTMPGIRVTQSGSDVQLAMRGSTGDCVPTIYLDGHRMTGLSASDIDSTVKPSSIRGIEVYSATNAPPQFHPGMTGCGSIVIWTR